MLKGPGLLPHSGRKAKKLVVFCHGYGSNGEDLLSLAPHWSKALPDAEFLSPNAPEPWEEYPSGYQWFSLREFTPPFIRAGLDVAGPILRDCLLEALEKRNLTPADLVIVGFSQGGMMALEMLFALPGLRGIICYSGGFYPPSPSVPSAASVSEPHPEILLVHGDEDTIVPYEYFLDAQKLLRNLGLRPQTLTCSGLGHSIDEEGLKAGRNFLIQLFGQEQPVIYRKQQ